MRRGLLALLAALAVACAPAAPPPTPFPTATAPPLSPTARLIATLPRPAPLRTRAPARLATSTTAPSPAPTPAPTSPTVLARLYAATAVEATLVVVVVVPASTPTAGALHVPAGENTPITRPAARGSLAATPTAEAVFPPQFGMDDGAAAAATAASLPAPAATTLDGSPLPAPTYTGRATPGRASATATADARITVVGVPERDTPLQGERVPILVTVRRGDQPVEGAEVYLVAHFSTVDSRWPRQGSVSTDARGSARIVVPVGRARPDVPVTVDLVAAVEGITYQGRTQFVPRARPPGQE